MLPVGPALGIGRTCLGIRWPKELNAGHDKYSLASINWQQITAELLTRREWEMHNEWLNQM